MGFIKTSLQVIMHRFASFTLHLFAKFPKLRASSLEQNDHPYIDGYAFDKEAFASQDLNELL